MTPEDRAREYAHSIKPVDLGSPEGIAVVARAIHEAEQRASLERSEEWAYVFAVLASSVVESLETVVELELKAKKGHPYYHGQMSLLQTLRRMCDGDLRRYGGEPSEEPTHAP